MALKLLGDIVDRAATRGGLAALAVLWLAVQAAFAVLIMQSHTEVRPLDLHFYYSSEEAYRTIEAYTEAERRRYVISALTLDMAYPVVYSLLIAAIFTRLLRRTHSSGSRWNGLRFTPLLVAIADVLENATAVSLVLNYPDQVPALAGSAGVLTAAKWSLAIMCLALLAVVGAVAAARGKGGVESV